MKAKKIDSIKKVHNDFDIGRCKPKSVWCGDGEIPKSSPDFIYTGFGTRTQCMKKGFGAGMYSERKKTLPVHSLQHIKYTGDVYEKKFAEKGLTTTLELIRFAKTAKKDRLKTVLRWVYTNSSQKLDIRSYNACLVYLYEHGVGTLPKCVLE